MTVWPWRGKLYAFLAFRSFEQGQPSGRLSMAMSCDCLLSARGVAGLVAALGLAAPLVRAAFLLVRVVVEAFDMTWTLSMKRATTIAALLRARAPVAVATRGDAVVRRATRRARPP